MKGYGEKSKSKKKNNQKLQLTKEQIIIQAFKFHAQGNILEAAKYYQFFIDQGFKNYRVFINYGAILLGQGNLNEAEESFRKAIELNSNFADAHLNLGVILKNLGKLKEAEISTRKAIELDPQNATALNNYISLLTVYKPEIINSNQICVINEEFKKLNLSYKKSCIITNEEAIKIYQDGLKIYKKYNLSLEVNHSQIYKSNEINFDCKRHKLIFNEHKIIPEFCFGCYKVQVEVDSIIELIKLFLVFNNLKLKNNNTRKVIIETRPNISGFYKGLIYCLDLNEALAISKKLNIRIQNYIKTNLISQVKRGCSEYPLEFPKYKEIRMSGQQPMNYNKKWRIIEKEVDQGNKDWGKSSKSIEGFNLNNFLIMRNWVAYAQIIRDESVNLITNEQIKGPKFLQNLNRDFITRKLQP